MSRPRSLGERIASSRFVTGTVGTLAAGYLQLVWRTSRFDVEPKTIYSDVAPDFPAIIAMWHGQHFLMPFVMRPQDKAKVLISRHRDGEMNAVAAERLGVGTIRGSGDHRGRFHRKGGVTAMLSMVEALEEGFNVALTADVPKVARRAGLGIVKLAQFSGRPIYCVAPATSRRITFRSWDRAVLNLPFSHGAFVGHGPIRVARDADDATLEAARLAVEETLNAVTERAYALVDGAPVDRTEVGDFRAARAGHVPPRAAPAAPLAALAVPESGGG